MLDLKKVLVPRDFSPFSDYAVQSALDLAERTGAELHLFYADVLHTDISSVGGGGTETQEIVNHRLLEGTQGAQIDSHTKIVTSVKRDLAAAPAIVAYAEENEIDLIVMGTHGRRGFRRLFIGSTAEEVIRTAPCPVMTIGKPDTLVGRLEGINAILVPTDLSEHARIALSHAKELAELYHTRLDLLHVVEERLHPAFYHYSTLSIYDVIPEVEEKALHEMEKVFAETDGPICGVKYHVRRGRASREIANFAKENDSDLIVMATHGLGGIKHAMIGSVAEKVARWSPAPVFTVKSFGKHLTVGLLSSDATMAI